MTNFSLLCNAKTVAGNGTEVLAGYVLQDEATGRQEFISDISFAGVCSILSRRTGTWSGRGYGIVNGQAFIYA